MEVREVLVVDDDPEIVGVVTHLLDARALAVVSAGSCREALSLVRQRRFPVIVLDVRLPDGTGPDLLPELQRASPDSAVVLLTGYGTTDLALASIRAGAFEFVEKSELVERLVPTVVAALRARDPDASEPFRAIVTRSGVMRAVLHTLRPALTSRVPVLVRGESGTGKELVARALHDGGSRRDQPFVAVNCAGIPEHLLEAELFGYERGAFTGAVARKPGRFDLARGGTLLLDEIGELHPSLQAKLLRVLQDGEYQRLGGVETLHADVRVLSATHRDLEREVDRGRFRHDLYYRLGVFTVELPPLRDRHGDIPLLVEHFVQRSAAHEHKRIEGVDPVVLELLASYSFPGNVRQLQNVVAHAVVVARGPRVRLADLPSTFLRAVALERDAIEASDAGTTPGGTPFPTLREVERRHVAAALAEADGNKARAARLLGVGRMTLYRKIEEFGLDRGGE